MTQRPITMIEDSMCMYLRVDGRDPIEFPPIVFKHFVQRVTIQTAEFDERGSVKFRLKRPREAFSNRVSCL